MLLRNKKTQHRIAHTELVEENPGFFFLNSRHGSWWSVWAEVSQDIFKLLGLGLGDCGSCRVESGRQHGIKIGRCKLTKLTLRAQTVSFVPVVLRCHFLHEVPVNPFTVSGDGFARFVEMTNIIVVFVVFFVARSTTIQRFAVILSLDVAFFIRMEVTVHGVFIRCRQTRHLRLKMERVGVRLLGIRRVRSFGIFASFVFRRRRSRRFSDFT